MKLLLKLFPCGLNYKVCFEVAFWGFVVLNLFPQMILIFSLFKTIHNTVNTTVKCPQ